MLLCTSLKWLYVWLKCTTIFDHVNGNTVEFAYKEPTYKEIPVIRNLFSFSNLSKELVYYTLIRNSVYKNIYFTVPMSS